MPGLIPTGVSDLAHRRSADRDISDVVGFGFIRGRHAANARALDRLLFWAFSQHLASIEPVWELRQAVSHRYSCIVALFAVFCCVCVPSYVRYADGPYRYCHGAPAGPDFADRLPACLAAPVSCLHAETTRPSCSAGLSTLQGFSLRRPPPARLRCRAPLRLRLHFNRVAEPHSRML